MPTANDYQKLLQQAALKIKSYRQELARLRQDKSEPIAIIGISCQFPGARNAHEFWDNLLDKKVSLSPLHEKVRWPQEIFADKIYATQAGFLDTIDQFD